MKLQVCKLKQTVEFGEPKNALFLEMIGIFADKKDR